jgi:hypothetical protein
VTVIAWDGKTIAADRQRDTAGMKHPGTKLLRLANGEAVSWCGSNGGGYMLADWYAAGAKPSRWPELKGDDFARLIVLRRDGLFVYETYPAAMKIEAPFIAFGSGGDFAMGAMAMGADARRAVEVASQFSTGCGLGCDTMQYEEPAARKAAVARPTSSARKRTWLPKSD